MKLARVSHQAATKSLDEMEIHVTMHFKALTLMLYKFSAQDRFAASMAAFSGPCSLFHFLLRELTYDYRDVIGRLRLEQAVECQLYSG